ncbi:MAG: MFS transporter [Clostridia bacterium]|nr:MFS transporter [Clostridia bacterium]
MATLLLIVIFTGFIGLGIPDSLLGSAWPAICEELKISTSVAWTITTPISCFTLLSSIFSAQIIEKFGVKLVAFISTLLTALALLGMSFANATWMLILLGFPLGIGAGAVDSGLNNYVALHYKASHMNFLHCFYGVGVALSPYLMSLALSFMTWRWGYRYASIIQFLIAVILLSSFPLWKVHDKTQPHSIETKVDYGSYKEVLKTPICIPVCLVFLACCAIEVTAGIWATTYLVDVKEVSKSDGAFYLVLYYVGLALGRFLSGVLSSKFSLNKINVLGLISIGIGVIGLLLPIKAVFVAVFALLLIGLGVAPFYPNFSFLTPKHFGEKNSQKAMGVQMVSAFIGIVVFPSLMGILTAKMGMKILAPYLAILLGILTISYIFYKNFEKKN